MDERGTSADGVFALFCPGRLLSCYRLTVGEDMMDVWVITEADRSATTLLLPSEY